MTFYQAPSLLRPIADIALLHFFALAFLCSCISLLRAFVRLAIALDLSFGLLCSFEQARVPCFVFDLLRAFLILHRILTVSNQAPTAEAHAFLGSGLNLTILH